jgi:putative salt-induced outer membrane protein
MENEPMRSMLALVLSCVSGAALAQTDPITGSAALGYLATSGNTESTNANAAFELDWDRGRDWTHHWRALAVTASTSDVTTAEAYSAGYTARRELSDTTYLFASGDWREDRFSGYDEQMTEAVGYGWRVIDNARQTLALEVGAGAKQSTLVDGTDLDEGIVRGALDYTMRISEASDFTQELVLEAGDDNRYTESVSALRATLIGDLALVLSYTLKNNSDVPIGVEKTDRFLAISLEYGF